jgi:glycosyltransferase involved in cell wall biosynthesis
MPPRFTTRLWPLARRILASRIRAHGGDRPDVLAITFPEYADLWDDLSAVKRLYYNYDDYAAHWPNRAEAIRRLEDRAVARADVTVCISDQRARVLRARFPERSNGVWHVPIGVSPAFMADAVRDAGEPAAIARIPRPRAGYVGTLTYRFDFPFLAEVAAARPDVSFVLGGRPPTRADGAEVWWQGVERSRALPNVHLIGWVNHFDLGKHLAAMDVLLMIYSRCSFNDSACPAKLWDYLGTGRAVVANANNPETMLWRDVVAVGDTPMAFAARLDEALAEAASGAPERREARLAVARAHTWDRLAERLAALAGLTPARTGSPP